MAKKKGKNTSSKIKNQSDDTNSSNLNTPFASFQKLAKTKIQESNETKDNPNKAKQHPQPQKKNIKQTQIDEHVESALFMDAVGRFGTNKARTVHKSEAESFSMSDVFKNIEKDENTPNIRQKDEVKETPQVIVKETNRKHLIERVDVSDFADSQEAIGFMNAMKDVTPVNGKGREVPPASKPIAQPVSDFIKTDEYLNDFINGKFEFSLEYTEEFYEGHVLGVDPLVLSRLRTGQYSSEAHCDMHGMTSEQAYEELLNFIRTSYNKGLRVLLVVTGRGKNSPGGKGILRENMQTWLTRDPLKRVVLAFCTAHQQDGGAGALYILLRKQKKKSGKILWDKGFDAGMHLI